MLNFEMSDSSLTERGQVSVPARLRKAMGLRTGQRLHWEQISDREILVSLRDDSPVGPLAVLGYARRVLKTPARRTGAWMKELREGE
ncbi:MAG: bifunctional DNA-binding transcriptional regulator [Verrucomicrobiales bacterium]|jgi:bifunctional DNA-binding transcriptional regulator/antitoxin component of YhaV-PrlF toxin-antitoxin module